MIYVSSVTHAALRFGNLRRKKKKEKIFFLHTAIHSEWSMPNLVRNINLKGPQSWQTVLRIKPFFHTEVSESPINLFVFNYRHQSKKRKWIYRHASCLPIDPGVSTSANNIIRKYQHMSKAGYISKWQQYSGLVLSMVGCVILQYFTRLW